MSATDPVSGGKDEGEGGLPRIVGTWKRAYALVIVALAVNVALLWLLGKVYG